MEDPSGAWGLAGNLENPFANLKKYFELSFAKLNSFFSVGIQICKTTLKIINGSATTAIITDKLKCFKGSKERAMSNKLAKLDQTCDLPAISYCIPGVTVQLQAGLRRHVKWQKLQVIRFA